ncbi:MAG TPA: hypothetical protein DCW86_02785 [Actinobacteria bacterium]|nr:hypothetical protein [Actinomycetota bacterium]
MHPEESPKETILLLGILLVLIFIVLTLIGIFAVKPPERKEKKGISKKHIWITVDVIVFIILLSLTMGSIYTSQPSFCKLCHFEKRYHQSWQTSPHKEATCLSCHQEPGAIGFCIEKFEMVKRAISYVKQPQREKPATTQITNDSCLRCHKKIEKKTVVRYTIRVSHKEFLEKGERCVDCHNTVAHERMILAKKYPSMDKCILCHDDRTASSDCELCHVEDIGKRPRETMDYPKVHLEEPTHCRGCHPSEACNECHGLEMPHPPGWEKGEGHAREGFARKDVCYRCHSNAFCAKCHSGNWPHEKEFIETHKTATVEECARCGHGKNICDLCH